MTTWSLSSLVDPVLDISQAVLIFEEMRDVITDCSPNDTYWASPDMESANGSPTVWHEGLEALQVSSIAQGLCSLLRGLMSRKTIELHRNLYNCVSV